MSVPKIVSCAYDVQREEFMPRHFELARSIDSAIRRAVLEERKACISSVEYCSGPRADYVDEIGRAHV